MPFDIGEFIDHPGQRLPIHLVLEGSWSDGGIRTVDRMTLDGEGFVQLGVLYVEGTVGGRVTEPCRRCLKPVTQSIERFEVFEVRTPLGEKELDLSDDLLRLVLSAHDPNVLCRKDCRGLCPICGADLNEDQNHTCHPPEEERRTLRDLLR